MGRPRPSFEHHPNVDDQGLADDGLHMIGSACKSQLPTDLSATPQPGQHGRQRRAASHDKGLSRPPAVAAHESDQAGSLLCLPTRLTTASLHHVSRPSPSAQSLFSLAPWLQFSRRAAKGMCPGNRMLWRGGDRLSLAGGMSTPDANSAGSKFTTLYDCHRQRTFSICRRMSWSVFREERESIRSWVGVTSIPLSRQMCDMCMWRQCSCQRQPNSLSELTDSTVIFRIKISRKIQHHGKGTESSHRLLEYEAWRTHAYGLG
ncbi:hypothetical protein B0I35DRAFT_213676 [Stachybotrys elegans]|uniref:Uncharacterized protein n=1 Tax=Stachybotrys elegans TaxID=80388 RepID=A0A8K0SVC5_9HYPO|nr:hypothetical protein B0I35DRAFT_213676 [Stachybotrys elegans]